MSKTNRITSWLAATALLLVSAGAGSLQGQSTCSDNLFTVTSNNGTTFPASGGTAIISWHKNSGASNSCPSFITTTAPWLTLQATNSASTTGSAGIVVAPNPSSATRSGVITVQSGAADSTNFTITQVGSTLTADQTSLTFNAPGGVAPPSQSINVTASGGAVQIGALISSAGNWLQVSQSSATTPAVLTVSVNPSGLAAGTYQSSLQIFGASLQIPVSVTLTVTAAGPALSFNPASTTIAGLAGGATPSAAAVVLKNTGTSASAIFNLVSDQSWLTATTSGVNLLGPGQSTPVNLTATAASLAPGTYTAHVSAQGAGSSLVLTVNFNVTGVSISALENPITLSISSGSKKSFSAVEQLAGDNSNVTISVTQGASYLKADATAKSPGSFGVTIDATALSPGTYSGSLLVQCSGNSCIPIPVQVNVTVNPGSGALNFTPAGETLAMTSGASTPRKIGASLENDGSSTTAFTIASDQNWLSATPTSGNLAPGEKTTISISTSSANLPPGTYTGHVFAQGTGTTGTFTVSLSVTGSNVSVTPNPLTLTLPAGTKQTFAGALQLSGDSASGAISVGQGSSYLSADVLSQSPGVFSVTADATKLAPGIYTGSLIVHCTPGCVPVTVLVSIVVTQGASNLSFGAPGVTLSGNAGSSTPQIAPTNILNAGNGPGGFTLLTDQSWLSVSPSSGTLTSGQSANIVVSATAQNLAPGNYTGHVTMGSAVFTVNLTVAGVALFASPSAASLNVAAGTKQSFNTEQVLGGSGLVNIAVTNGRSWLSSDATVPAPASFNFTIDATRLKPGSYTGTLSFTCQTACVPFTLQINLLVTSNSSLVFTPSAITFTFYQGRQTPAAQTISVKSNDGSPVNFTVTNPFPWLTISSSSGTTPATLTLTPNLAGIGSGTSGNLTFTTGNTQTSALLPVILNVLPFGVSATPSPVAVYAVGGQHGQANIAIGTADNAAASLIVTSANFWLSAPATFTAPGTLPIKVDATTLGVGAYQGTIILSCAGVNPCPTVQVPVNLTVTNTAMLLSDTQNIAFPSQTAQAVHLSSSDNVTSINYSIAPSTLPNWLAVSVDRLSTPATLIFSVPNPPAQTATANVTINSPYGSIVIVVTDTPPAGPTINSGGVVSAGGLQNVIRPGSWATIYGSKLSTSTARDWGAGDFSGNAFPTSLDGVSVMVGGKAAYVRTISPTQINFQCPDGIGTGLEPVTVTNSLGTSNTVMVTVANYAPGFFIGTITPTRTYVSATETQNGGTIYIGPGNSPGVRPARAGDNLTLWGTGFGPTTPNVPAGSLFSGAAALNDTLVIQIDGVSAATQFAGITAAGLYQFNIVVPNLLPGDHKIAAMIGGVSTPDGIWLSTQ